MQTDAHLRTLHYFHLGPHCFQLGLELIGNFLLESLLNRLGESLNHFLGFLEAEAGHGPHLLDEFDFQTRIKSNQL